MSPRHRGFTLIELMIVLVILGIVLVLVVPGFSSVFLSTRLSNYANEIVAGIYLSRGEAIKHNRPVTLCASADGLVCSGSNDWGQGWVILDPDDELLKSQAPIASGFLLQAVNGAHTLIFDGSGLVDSSVPATSPPPFSFRICQATPSTGNQERTVIVNRIGKTSVETTRTNTCP